MRKIAHILLKISFIGLFVFTMGCESDNTSSGNGATALPPIPEIKPEKPRAVPAFDKEAAYQFVDKQVAFGTRVTGSEGHQACKAWLVSQFKNFGATVIEQDFQAKAYTGTMLNGTNIIAQYNPEIKKRIILAAHWDTRHIADHDPDATKQGDPILGADDGGSGVGVLLEIAKQLNKNGLDIGVDIILFDAEDHGSDGGNDVDSWCLGSQHWAKNPHVKGYRAKYGVLLDMVGSKGARFPQEGLSMRVAPQLVNKIWKLAGAMKYNKYFVPALGKEITDDHTFVNAMTRIPMIDIINLPEGNKTFGHYWHTHKDNMSVIDKEALGAVGQVMLAVVYRENNGTF